MDLRAVISDAQKRVRVAYADLMRHYRVPPPVASALPYAALAAVGAALLLRALLASRASRAPAAVGTRAARGIPTDLNAHEAALVGDLVPGEDMEVTFDSIGGLAGPIAELEELVILPLSHPELFSHSSLLQSASGVLLYGPPGTGKTLLAKAVARGTRASFLAVNAASIQSKWYGETPKMVEAVFTLAQKMSPCVVFVDEADGLLATRSDMDASHVNAMKTKFLEAWDGLKSGALANATKREGGGGVGRGWVLVIGATNKPWSLDPAVLRRMPRQIVVSLPDREGRRDILVKLLRAERVAEGLELGRVAAATEGYSGSDLKELVKAAVMIPVREVLPSARRAAATAAAGGGGGGGAPPLAPPRPLEERDLLAALPKVKATGVTATSYQAEQLRGGSGGAAFAADVRGVAADVARALAGAVGAEGGGGGGAPVFIPGRSMRANSANLSQHVDRAARWRGRGGGALGSPTGRGGGALGSPTGRGGGARGSPQQRTSPARRQP